MYVCAYDSSEKSNYPFDLGQFNKYTTENWETNEWMPWIINSDSFRCKFLSIAVNFMFANMYVSFISNFYFHATCSTDYVSSFFLSMLNGFSSKI